MTLNEYLSERGAQARLAREINAQPQLVWQWANGVRKVPLDRCIPIERASAGAVTCESLRPDVDWAYLRNSEPDQAQAHAASAQPAIETVAKEGADAAQESSHA